MSSPRVALTGSTLSPEGQQHWIGAADPNQPIIATVVLRRRPSAANLGQELLAGAAQPISRDEVAQIGADPQEMDAVRDFVVQNGLKIIDENPATRTIRMEGTVQQMDNAFGIKIGQFEGAQGRQFLSYQGTISIPASLEGVIVAVLGLDQRPVARHHC